MSSATDRTQLAAVGTQVENVQDLVSAAAFAYSLMGSLVAG